MVAYRSHCRAQFLPLPSKMDFLSESTKKERRNLLATGFAGIIVAQLKTYPTDIELAGLKFHSPELPFIAVGESTMRSGHTAQLEM